MSRKQLHVHYEGLHVGILEEDSHSLLQFTYAHSWLERKDAFPLSLAMALQHQVFQGRVVTSFFENLIPEGEQRRQLERIAGLPEADDLAFLERFGDDCAGALSISTEADPKTSGRLNHELPISYETIEYAVDNGTPIQAAVDLNGELPPFSLAGAQAKFPCSYRNGQIQIPVGKPTTISLNYRFARAINSWIPLKMNT